MLCAEIDAGTIPCAKEYESADAIVEVFKIQFAAYARGEYPFEVQLADLAAFDTRKFWRKLGNHPDACFIAVSNLSLSFVCRLP